MEWTATIGPALLTLLGVVLTLAYQAVNNSRKDRAVALRRRETEWDLLHLSRRSWIDAAMEARQVAREGGDLPPLPVDAWETRGQ